MIKILFLLLYGFAAPLLLVPGILLTLCGETLPGRLSGIQLLALASLPPALYFGLASRKRGKRRFLPALLGGSVFVALGVWLYLLAPPEREPPETGSGAGASSHFLGPRGEPFLHRWNRIPEIDQVKLGTYLAPFFDALMDWKKARQVRRITLPLYRDMGECGEFRSLESALTYAYLELLGADFDLGHFFQYLPARASGERLPLLLFLHGSAGNFQCFLWVWKQFADRYRFAILCPSFGFGNWSRKGGVEIVERVREYAVNELPIQPDRIYLAGLSNGGTGLTRAAGRNPSGYRGLIFISAVLEREVVTSPGFVEGWRDRPVLIIHGDRDERVPLSCIEPAVKELSRKGVQVTFRIEPEGDHFLLFSSLEKTLEEVGGWIAATGRNYPPAEIHR